MTKSQIEAIVFCIALSAQGARQALAISIRPAQPSHFHYITSTVLFPPTHVHHFVEKTAASAPVLSSPKNGATLRKTAAIKVSAQAARIDLYVDSTLIETKPTWGIPALTFSLNTSSLANGSHILWAKAYDADGNAETTNSVMVTVKNTQVLRLVGLRINLGALPDSPVAVVPQEDKSGIGRGRSRNLLLKLSLHQSLLFSDQVSRATIYDLAGHKLASQEGGGELSPDFKPGRYLIQIFDDSAKASVVPLTVAR